MKKAIFIFWKIMEILVEITPEKPPCKLYRMVVLMDLKFLNKKSGKN